MKISELDFNKIEIPNIQRGFVWKANQIENFWNSLIKQYPIGSFIYKKNENKISLFDGQQRITALSLGMGGTNTFKSTIEKIRIFIDLKKSDEEDKYIFRVNTKSHPWGYDLNDNTKTLKSEFRSKACEKCFSLDGAEKYYEKDLGNFWPCDCYFPVPVDLFFKDESKDEINNWIKEHYNLGYNEIIDFYQNEKTTIDFSKTLQAVKIQEERGKEKKKNKDENKQILEFFTINELIDAFNKIKDISLSFLKIPDTAVEETVFQRINRGGTAITQEELNYSIVKSNTHIDSSLIERFEKECSNFFKPATLMAIVYRLFQAERKNEDTFSLSIKTKDFKREFMSKDTASELNEYLVSFLDNKTIQNYKTVLLYSKENPLGLPFEFFVHINKNASELALILFYRICVKGDNFLNDTNLRQKAIACLTTLYFFYYGGVRRNYLHVLNVVRPLMIRVDAKHANLFWSRNLIERAELLDDDKKEEIPHLKKSMNEKQKIEIIEQGIFWDRDLLLYAQREFLYESFDQNLFTLEDTDRPYDFDHIAPNSWSRKIKNNPRFKDLYQSIGNFRAWPLSDNRSDKDISPVEKIKTPTDWRNSFCRQRCWKNVKQPDVKGRKLKDEDKPLFDAITNRNIDIYREWFDGLGIKDILVSKISYKDVIRDVFNLKDVSKLPRNKGYIKIGNRFFVSISDDYINKNYPLEEENILFEFSYEDKEFNPPKTLPEGTEEEEEENKKTYRKRFTLLSSSSEGYEILRNDIVEWLNQFSLSISNEFQTLIK